MARREGSKVERVAVISLPCMCAELRRAARVVAQIYDEALRPSGLLAAQFTLLQTLKLAPGVSQKRLAELLGLDSTTLTRTLAVLRRKGWMRSEAGEDRRALRLYLTAEGLKEYKQVVPYWQVAQRRLRRELGEAGWSQVKDAAMRVAEVGLA